MLSHSTCNIILFSIIASNLQMPKQSETADLKVPAFSTVFGLGQLHNYHMQIVRGRWSDKVLELQKDNRQSSQVVVS